MNKITAIRGFSDILPTDSQKWRQVEQVLADVLDCYGFSQIRVPIVEETQLFARGVGEATDIVEKEMFGVIHGGNKGDESTSFTLRPEGTAGVVRAVIEHNLTRGDTPKLWYMGAMFRYERPQKGRYRQFHQLGAESFGSALPDADAEMIAMTAMMWKRLGVFEHLTLQLNTLGESDERIAYKTALVEYLTAHFDGLDDDSQRRLTTNPLRILDSKDEQTQAILLGAPKLSEFLGEESRLHFEQVQNYLHTLGIDFEINEKLVRGLDYYNKTVFEWVTDKLGSQATVCGGGRYDGLIGIVKGKPEQSEPAVGFAMGLERLMLLINEVNPIENQGDCDVFVVASPEVYANAILYANELRVTRYSMKVKMASATSLKSQMKKADKSGARFTVIIGGDEVANGTISVKNMATGKQKSFESDEMYFDLTDFDELSIYDAWQDKTGTTLPELFGDFEQFATEYSDFAEGVYLHADFDKEGTKLAVQNNSDEFVERIHIFANANGSGSEYAFWQHTDDTSLENAPIVVLGDEGGIHVVAQNFKEWLSLLTLDCEITALPDDAYFYQMTDKEKAEYNWQPSEYAGAYQEWASGEQGLGNVDVERANMIIQNAQARYGDEFSVWCNQFFDE